MDLDRWQSLPALLFDQAQRLGDKPFLWAKREGAYRPLTWAEVADVVSTLSRGLRGIGVKPGDRVVLVSENRPEWLIADLAIMTAGAITVPAYTTNNVGDHHHILSHSGAVGAIVSTKALAHKVLPAAIDAPECRFVANIQPPALGQDTTVETYDWWQLLDDGAKRPDDVAEMVAKLKRDDTACFIYTSGTGGTPKGVMLSHLNIMQNCLGAYDVLKTLGVGDEVFLSFLPLSHAYEHSGGQFFPMALGAQIFYAESVEKLLTNLAEVRPTLMTAVPRLYESIYQRILKGVEKQGGLKAKLFHRTIELGRKRYLNPGSLTLGERINDAMLTLLVRRKVEQRFGGRLKAFVSGGAALNPDIGIFFTALGLRILQGYGQTEAAPVISVNLPGKVKMETVGPPMTGVQVRIAEDGEILVRGPMVMKGYWRDEAATKAVLKNGWLHTGDIGEIDAEGFVKITDRKKDIIVFSGGDNVSPARIEGFLTLQPELHQAMVYGDKRPNLVALLVPDPDFLRDWARENGKSGGLAELHGDPELRKAISAAVERVNAELSPLEKVRRFSIAPEAFSVDNHMMTPTLKIRRHKIKESYGSVLDGLYDRRPSEAAQNEAAQSGS